MSLGGMVVSVKIMICQNGYFLHIQKWRGSSKAGNRKPRKIYDVRSSPFG